MTLDSISPSISSDQPPVRKSYRWLWIIILSVSCFCLTGLAVTAYKVLNQKGPQIVIKEGKLNGKIYTNKDESLICNFENYITPDILLKDSVDNGVGMVDLYNSATSINLTIQYLVPTTDVQTILSDPARYGEGISLFAQKTSQDFQKRFPNSNLLISEVQNDNNVFVVYIVPDARYSYFDNPASDLDLLLGIFFFAKSQYAYIIQEGFPLNNELQALSKDSQIDFVRTRIEEASKTCTFNR